MFQLRSYSPGLADVSTAVVPPCSMAQIGQQCIPDGAPSSGVGPKTFNIGQNLLSRLTSAISINPTASAATGTGVFSTGASPPAMATAPVLTPVASPWYTTWWGILLILGGGYFGYKKFIAK